eukprot:CAMPEP_0182913596 /NCGR_PEP_ID=MMETSP0034_2-20130328/38122_1 /TAXON_ID=156128 /ORGANISM="Nephroselmis pyriformis, Strain CCMP717" /LENGTH=335 /DNA_ID=CAMNT_0025050323 /DNA_START=115 /DNA_END=1118 /DNA_ORIENTATION=+
MGNGQSRRNREQRNAAHAQQGGAYNPHGGFHAPQAFQPPPGQMQYYGQTQFQGQNQFYGQFPPPPQHYPQQMPPAPAPETQRTQTIRNDVNLKKGTLQLVQSPTDPDLYYATFLFDAAKPCSVSVFFGVTEESSEKCMLRAGKVPFGPRLFYSKSGKDGLGQTHEQEARFGIRKSQLTEQDMESVDNYFPLVVRLETVRAEGRQLDAPPGSPLETWVQAQSTYAKIFAKEDGGLGVRMLKQKIWVEGVSYELQEIYGIEPQSTVGGEDGEDMGRECVICMSEPRDTTVLPCRHMCMCAGCAQMLRQQTNRCPICRNPVESLLEIKVEKKNGAGAG